MPGFNLKSDLDYRVSAYTFSKHQIHAISKYAGDNDLGVQMLCQGANRLISGRAGCFCVTLEVYAPLSLLSSLQPALSLLLFYLMRPDGEK